MQEAHEIENQGVLSKIFLTNATARILDFFLDHKDFDYPIAEVARKSRLSLRTVAQELPRLESIGLITIHRKVGKATMYKLTPDMYAIELLDKFVLDMSQQKLITEPQRMTDYQEVITDPIPAEQ